MDFFCCRKRKKIKYQKLETYEKIERIETNLIEEILINIFHFLDTEDLLSCSLVSNYFNQLSNMNMLWDKFVTNLFKNKFTYWILNNEEIDKENKKKLYYLSIRDSKRIEITKEELYSHFWCFSGDVFYNKKLYFPIYTTGIFYFYIYLIIIYI
jgi:hypothetical protein